eukprot:7382983-Prymnesium_polylepis.1
MPAASRRSRAASARSSRRSTLKTLASSSASTSGSAVPSVFASRTRSCGGAAAFGSCLCLRACSSCGNMSSYIDHQLPPRCNCHLLLVGIIAELRHKLCPAEPFRAHLYPAAQHLQLLCGRLATQRS